MKPDLKPSEPDLQPSETEAEPMPSALTSAALGGGYISVGAGGAGVGGAGIGVSGVSGDVGLVEFTVTSTTSLSPLILPGLFTAVSPQSAMPIDRVSFGYGYFDGFRTIQDGRTVPGFNLNLFNIGLEKTFFNELGSFYASVPLLYASNNHSGQPIDGVGDLNLGAKLVLYRSPETGSLFSAGLTVSPPTGRSARVTATTTVSGSVFDEFNFAAVPTTKTATTTVNPTFLQPWAGGLLIIDRFFVEGYLSVVVPTDERVATLLNTNLSVGYNLYQNPTGLVSWITPVFGIQTLVPLNHTDSLSTSTSTRTFREIRLTPDPDNDARLIEKFEEVAQPQLPNEFGFPTQVFLTGLVHFGIGERASIYAGASVPVAGPRGYTVGGIVGINFYY